MPLNADQDVALDAVDVELGEVPDPMATACRDLDNRGVGSRQRLSQEYVVVSVHNEVRAKARVRGESIFDLIGVDEAAHEVQGAPRSREQGVMNQQKPKP